MLLPQIARRRRAHQEKNPDAKIISLGIGDTTEPIPPAIVAAMKAEAEALGTLEGYSGWVLQGEGVLGSVLVGQWSGVGGVRVACGMPPPAMTAGCS